LLIGKTYIKIKVTIEGKNIKNNFLNAFFKVLILFFIIKTTAIKGKNRITISHINKIMGKKTNEIELTILLENFFSEKIISEIKKINKIISFLPKTSISAIGYKINIGDSTANNCSMLNLIVFKK
jgi:hypothetical protein